LRCLWIDGIDFIQDFALSVFPSLFVQNIFAPSDKDAEAAAANPFYKRNFTRSTVS